MTEQTLIDYTYKARLGWTQVDADGHVVLSGNCKFPLESVKAGIETAVADFNQDVPKKEFFRIDIQNGPPYEPIGLPSRAKSILGVYWQFTSSVDAALLGSNLEIFPASPYSQATDLLEVFINTYQLDALQEYLRSRGVDYEFTSGNSLKIITPSQIRTVWVLFSYNRSLADFEDDMKVVLSLRVAETAIRAYLMNKERSAGFQRAGGIVEFGGGQALESAADKYAKQWEDRLVGFAKLAMIGNGEGQ